MKPNRMRYFYIKTALVGFSGIFLSVLLLLFFTMSSEKSLYSFLLQALETSALIAIPVGFVVVLIYALERVYKNKNRD